jgi:hypothetical protein
MKKWKIWTGILLIFLAGSCIGAVGTGLYVRHKVVSILDGGAPAVAELVSRRLARRLDLSVSQQAAVSQIVRDTQFRLQQLRRRYLPDAEKIIVGSIDRIKMELTPEQQTKLDVLYDRFKVRWKMRGDNQEKIP